MNSASKYRQFLNSENWKKAAELCKKRDGYRCRVCNGTERLSAHHRTYEHKGDELNHLGDLTTLCAECHTAFHQRVNPKLKEEFIQIDSAMVDRLQSGSKSQTNRLKFLFGIGPGFRWIDLIGEVVPKRTWNKALVMLRK
jgi:hypothetical protein